MNLIANVDRLLLHSRAHYCRCESKSRSSPLSLVRTTSDGELETVWVHSVSNKVCTGLPMLRGRRAVGKCMYASLQCCSNNCHCHSQPNPSISGPVRTAMDDRLVSVFPCRLHVRLPASPSLHRTDELGRSGLPIRVG